MKDSDAHTLLELHNELDSLRYPITLRRLTWLLPVMLLYGLLAWAALWLAGTSRWSAAVAAVFLPAALLFLYGPVWRIRRMRQLQREIQEIEASRAAESPKGTA